MRRLTKKKTEENTQKYLLTWVQRIWNVKKGGDAKNHRRE